MAGAESVRVQHYDCEDCWYSCPKSEDGCCNDVAGTECNCGAGRRIATIRGDQLGALFDGLDGLEI